MIDIILISISNSSQLFVKLTNQEDVSFKIQYILEILSSIHKGFTYNLVRDSNNDITGIVWMTLYIR